MAILNAAIWFGAAIFFTFFVGPGIFCQDVHKLFGEAGFSFYAGGVALVLIKRYFVLQNICGAIALLHLFGEWLYLGRKANRFLLGMLLVIFAFGLLGQFSLEPKMAALRQTMYFGATQTQKDEASRSFNVLHGISQAVNLLIIAGIAGYLVRVTRPPEAGRYSSTFAKFRS